MEEVLAKCGTLVIKYLRSTYYVLGQTLCYKAGLQQWKRPRPGPGVYSLVGGLDEEIGDYNPTS